LFYFKNIQSVNTIYGNFMNTYLYVFTFRSEEGNSAVENYNKFKTVIEQLQNQVKEVSTIDSNKIYFFTVF